MNLLNEILNEYNSMSYYNMNGYIAINDDRIGRIVMFKLFLNEKGVLKVLFKEKSQITALNATIRSDEKTIKSLDDFKEKWYQFYNDLH